MIKVLPLSLDTKMPFIKFIARQHDFLRQIKLGGPGRTNETIIREMNEAIRINNALAGRKAVFPSTLPRTLRSRRPVVYFERKERWPVPLPKRSRVPLTADEADIWEYYNKNDLVREMLLDCTHLEFNPRAKKRDLSRLWIRHGNHKQTREFRRRDRRYRDWCTKKAQRRALGRLHIK